MTKPWDLAHPAPTPFCEALAMDAPRFSHRRPLRVLLPVGLSVLGLFGCAAAGPRHVAMAPLFSEAERQVPSAPEELAENYFHRDRTTGLSEAELHRILEAPVFLAERARIGLVPVSDRYDVEIQLPFEDVIAKLGTKLTSEGQFEAVTEVSTDWPAQGSVAGLRELAARYRTDYLLLYRHRFVDHDYQNAWSLFYPTVIGAFLVPAQTVETNGILEATLFDVKTGTILFTVFERVFGSEEENVWHPDRKRRRRQRDLLESASHSLARQVVEKVGVLMAARPERSASEISRSALLWREPS